MDDPSRSYELGQLVYFAEPVLMGSRRFVGYEDVRLNTGKTLLVFPKDRGAVPAALYR